MGDGDYLAVVSGHDLLEALNVVEENYGQYSSIKVCRANVDERGQLNEEEKDLFEISRFIYDERIRESVEKSDA